MDRQLYPGQLDAEKEALFDEAGFAYDFDRGIFVSASLRKVISEEAAEDRTIDDLRSFIRKPLEPGASMAILFNGPIPDHLATVLARRFGWTS